MIKDFMRTAFPKLIDILFVISMSGVVLVSMMYIMISFWGFLAMLVGGGISVILSFGVIYLLMDIRDALYQKSEGQKNQDA